ncbi:transcriptional regulator [Bacillus phage Pavlov]|uniref:transcriptional regulator n=1 Tax=Bacillus phage Pavlov TaxID=1675598 RepID=UPI00065F2C0D|nr:transcriptional regulator [Bacillus phage Pavlov]AKQ07458.1 transcriptional regulator [Bacillus phage Pavlov]
MKIFATKEMRLARMRKGYSIVDLARKAEMSRQAVGQVELMKNGVSPANAKKLADALGTTFESIFIFKERGE